MPSSTTSDVLWATKLVDNGKEEELTFTSPEKTGDYPYALHLLAVIS